jgi:methyl-accepting chemotaxis protein
MNTTPRLLLTSLGPVIGLMILSWLTFLNQRDLHRSHDNRHESLRLANELRVSSEELTRLARTYVVTGDADYEKQYWHVLDIRNGKQPRPDGRTMPLRTLMQQQGFTPEEFAKLQEAEDNSNSLVTTETIAMHAIKGEFDDGRGGYTKKGPPDLELARQIMHDDKYHSDKSIIMGPIGEFVTLLDDRTEKATLRFRRWGDLLQVVGLILTAVALVTAWLGIRRHAAALRHAIGKLSDSCEHVATGATEVASSSRHLAHGATEQVAALEEISTSAREMAAGATDNARRTQSASELVAREQQEFAGATVLLGEMVTAIEQIAEAGGRISKINKLVDEIAFQTNILALNAAVEAARAGEAGQGFAVVADEVRRLAQRCAGAAGESTALIEESIVRTQVGHEKMSRLSEAIRTLSAVATEVRGLMDNVRDGSRAQHDAVARIGAAIGQIEQVTHRAAAGAEEGSVAAEEMTAQAVALRDVVADLETMVGSGRKAETAGLIRP